MSAFGQNTKAIQRSTTSELLSCPILKPHVPFFHVVGRQNIHEILSSLNINGAIFFISRCHFPACIIVCAWSTRMLLLWKWKVSTDVNSRDRLSKVCFNPPHDDVTKTEGLHFHQKISAFDSVEIKSRLMISTVWTSSIMRATAFSKTSKLERQDRRGSQPCRWD